MIETSPSNPHHSTSELKTLPSDRETSPLELEPPTSEHES